MEIGKVCQNSKVVDFSCVTLCCTYSPRKIKTICCFLINGDYHKCFFPYGKPYIIYDFKISLYKIHFKVYEVYVQYDTIYYNGV